MDNEILRLKTDILNELRNERYYLIDELQKIAGSLEMKQREKVSLSCDVINRIVLTEHSLDRVETLFTQAPTQEEIENDGQVLDDKPSNVIESSNQHGQSHSE